MMKKHLFMMACMLVLSVQGAFGQARFLTWGGYPKDGNLETYFKEMHDVGLDGLLANSSVAQLKEMIPVAAKYGVEIHAWREILSNGAIAKKHPEWLDYNRLGQSMLHKKAYVAYYKFLNPIIPGVQKAIIQQLEPYAEIEGLASISLDYCRYVDAILPTTLWEKYDIVQDQVYPEWDYGYHPAMIKAFEKEYSYDPRNQEDVNGDKQWAQFRYDAVTNLVNQIETMVRSHNKELTASPFPTPKMSRRMVYQDWGKWNLDRAYPMIYNGFYNQGTDWVGQCVADCMKDAHKGTAIYAGLYIPSFQKGANGGTLTEAVHAALDAGAKGFALFTFDSMSKQQKKELKTVIRSIKDKK